MIIRSLHKVGRILLRSIAVLLLLLAVVVLLCYIPLVQNVIKEYALGKVKEASGLAVSVERLRVGFPLNVDVDGVLVVDESADTMARVRHLSASVDLMPLFSGVINVSEAKIVSADYRMGDPDSTLFVNASGVNVSAADVSLSMSDSEIGVGRLEMTGASVGLRLGADTVTADVDTAATVPWKIAVSRFAISDVACDVSIKGVADSIGAYIGDVWLENGKVDLSVSPPLVETGEIHLSKSNVTYNTIAGASPEKGLDMNYLQVDSIDMRLASLYNKGGRVRCPLQSLTAVERCGVHIEASGLFEMDDDKMRLDSIALATLFSRIDVSAELGLASENAPVMMCAAATIGPKDIELLYPSLHPLLKGLPRNEDIVACVNVTGTMSDLKVRDVSLELPGHVKMALNGQLSNLTDMDMISGHIDISGNVQNADFVKHSVMESRLTDRLRIPPMTISGTVDAAAGNINGGLMVTAVNGDVALDAMWNGGREMYSCEVKADSFPVNAFLPEMGFGALNADIELDGSGYDIASPATRLNACVVLRQMQYKGRTYENARLWTSLANGDVELGMASLNTDADFDIVANAHIDKNMTLDWTVDGDVRQLNLQSLGLSSERCRGALSIKGNGVADFDVGRYEALVDVRDIEWLTPGLSVNTSRIEVGVSASDSIVKASILNNDMSADFVAVCSLDSLLPGFMRTVAELDSQIVNREINVARLQRCMPRFVLTVNGGSGNVINSLLASNDMSVDALSLNVKNDSLFNMQGCIERLRIGDTRLDSVGISALQHSKYLIYKVALGNRPGTLDKFAHVAMNGYIADDKLAAFVRQHDIEGRVGFNFGVMSALADSSVTLRFTPVTPVIGYKNWTLNSDNYVEYNYVKHHLDANLRMSSDESHLNLFTEHSHEMDGGIQEDVVLNLSNIKLSELLTVSPYAPPIKGSVSAGMRFRWDASTISGDGVLSLDEMYFGRSRVGSFALGVDVETTRMGTIKAEASLMVDSVRTIMAKGVLNDTSAVNPFNLDFKVERFPLKVLNPFFPKNTVSLSGALSGEMDVTGELASPRFNGYVNFDTASVKVSMLGSSYLFSDAFVPVRDNKVAFDDYAIYGANENPMKIKGLVDMGDLISPLIGLSFNARNMQFMNSSRGRGADIYGKGFMNLDADVKGDISKLDIDASFTLLGGSNITYVMADAATAIASQNTGEMVRFVQFADTAAVEEPDSIVTSSMAMDIDALIRVSSGTTINVDLSADGKNRVQLQGSGSLNYTMNDMDDSRFTGRYTIDKGFVRYTPPLMSEKLFDFEEGSYVAFNGDMFNPILNIHATDKLRANVSKEGQNSRLVNFEVGLSVTNTLSNMNVEFDMASSDDIAIQNELQSMSAEQRANQAMNLLLYNVYTGPGTTANANLAGNPLYSFLESQINTWAANNIKFVDISFGIDKYDTTQDGATSSTTNYSYKVSKTLFNDRFKIVVGGNYSTDADTDEDVAQNLINDISFEYMLNRSGSMYVKIFRHVGYESILEGEVTQTGVGFVYKRKLQTLRDIFRFGRRKPPVPKDSVKADNYNEKIK